MAFYVIHKHSNSPTCLFVVELLQYFFFPLKTPAHPVATVPSKLLSFSFRFSITFIRFSLSVISTMKKLTNSLLHFQVVNLYVILSET